MHLRQPGDLVEQKPRKQKHKERELQSIRRINKRKCLKVNSIAQLQIGQGQKHPKITHRSFCKCLSTSSQRTSGCEKHHCGNWGNKNASNPPERSLRDLSLTILGHFAFVMFWGIKRDQQQSSHTRLSERTILRNPLWEVHSETISKDRHKAKTKNDIWPIAVGQ